MQTQTKTRIGVILGTLGAAAVLAGSWIAISNPGELAQLADQIALKSGLPRHGISQAYQALKSPDAYTLEGSELLTVALQLQISNLTQYIAQLVFFGLALYFGLRYLPLAWSAFANPTDGEGSES